MIVNPEELKIVYEKEDDGRIRPVYFIDAVQVVRCKDCINYTRGKDEWGSCFENQMKLWRDTDYCSWGERREDD